MTVDALEQFSTGLGSLVPYWAFMLATAGGLYKGMIFVGGHFPENFKSDLSRWLDGVYETTWSTHFCRLFDIVFGEKHFSIKRFVRSSIASVLSVFALYILFAHVLGVLGARTFGSMPIWQALLVGAVINIIPDYLSLIETRWLLERFGKMPSVAGHIALLIADLIFSAAIVLAGIYTYIFLSGARLPSPVEIVALFSVYSVFFYSTFLTSAWAWVYCLSGWFLRLFTKVGLRNVLDIKKDPVKQIALVGAAVMVLGGMSIGPILQPQKGGFSNHFDDFICSLDLRSCFLAAHAAGDTERVAQIMVLACTDEDEKANCGARLDESFSPNDLREINTVWKRACDGGFARACRAYGYFLEKGKGNTKPDLSAAFEYYEMACKSGDLLGCRNLGIQYEKGTGVTQNLVQAIVLFKKACEGGEMGACQRLGTMYENGKGLDHPDLNRAVELYRQACDGGEMHGCDHLGTMYYYGDGLEKPDPKRAFDLYQQACDGAVMGGCDNLGIMYENGDGGVAPDPTQAVDLYSQACDGGSAKGCNHLGRMFDFGIGMSKPDPTRATELYKRACEGGVTLACQ